MRLYRLPGRGTDIVRPNPLLITPIRDLNDAVVMQTAIIGEAEVLCARDQDFFDHPAEPFLRTAGIQVLDDIALMHRFAVLTLIRLTARGKRRSWPVAAL